MVNKFYPKYKIGEHGEKIFEQFCKNRDIMLEDLRKIPYYMAHDTDYRMIKNGVSTLVEVKADTRDFYNIPVEIIKNSKDCMQYNETHKGKKGVGWLYETISKYMVWINLESMKMFVLDTKKLRDYCTKYKQNYMHRVNENENFDSINMYVPRKDLVNAGVLVGKYIYDNDSENWKKDNPLTELDNPVNPLYERNMEIF